MIKRQFMLIAGALLGCSLLAFAGGTEEGSSGEAMAAERTGKYGEAPMLAALVAAGELPPVDERLPVNPSVRTHWRKWARTAAPCACSPSTTGRGRT